MAFKRDGDDFQVLGALKRRRVDELFVSDIPEDEAILMKNGKFACMVCSQRPVFDTVNMLAIHRSGKKHLACAELFMAKKQELQKEIIKRRQQQYLKDGTTTVTGVLGAGRSRSGQHALLHAKPYDPCVKKKRKPHQRRAVLDLDCVSGNDNAAGNGVPSFKVQTIHEYVQKKKAQSCGINTLPAKPYVRKADKSKVDTSSVSPLDQGCGPVRSWTGSAAGYSSQQEPQIYRTESAFSSTESETPNRIGWHCDRNNVGTSTFTAYSQQDSVSVSQPTVVWGQQKTPTVPVTQQHSAVQAAHLLRQTHTAPQVVTSGDSSKDAKVYVHRKYNAQHRSKLLHSPPVSSNEQRVQNTEKYLQLRGAGWKKDWQGNWIKDENAEFDSDEEPPQLP